MTAVELNGRTVYMVPCTRCSRKIALDTPTVFGGGICTNCMS